MRFRHLYESTGLSGGEDKVDLIHVSAGIVSTEHHAAITHPTMFLPHGVNVKYAEAVKKAVNIPVVTVGAITDPDFGEQILAEDRADVISMARGLIADPYFPKKAKTGSKVFTPPEIPWKDAFS